MLTDRVIEMLRDRVAGDDKVMLRDMVAATAGITPTKRLTTSSELDSPSAFEICVGLGGF